MILVDNELQQFQGTVNPASVNLTLYNKMRKPAWYWHWPLCRLAARLKLPEWSKLKVWDKYTLMPGEFILLSTAEYTRIPKDCGAMLFLRSTYGRLGLEHSHAGFGDPGFSGQWTLEISNIAPWPVTIHAGQAIIQMVVFKTTAMPEKHYGEVGRYQGQWGPTEPIKES